MAYKTKPKNSSARRRGGSRANLILNTADTKITSKKTILYSDVIRREILQNDELVTEIINEIEGSDIIESVFEKAGYIPLVDSQKITNKKAGPKRNFKSDEDRQKAREHIIERHANDLDKATGEAGIVTNDKGRKRQDRKKVKGIPTASWNVGVAENGGRKTVVIYTDDPGISFQEAELGKIASKMRRRSKRNKTPEDGV